MQPCLSALLTHRNYVEGVMMDLNYLRKLLKIFDDSSAVELRIEEEGVNLRLAKQSNGTMVQQLTPQHQVFHVPSAIPAAPSLPATTAEQTEQQEQPKAAAPAQPTNTHQIVSPIVGTFYRSPAPDAEQFVQVGMRVTPGTTLCIVEAMKLMNEIESDVAGTIVKVLVENAQPVEYGQPLFDIQLD